MNADGQSPPLTIQKRIDEICGRFGTALTAGERPRIEAYLGDWQEPTRSVLLHDLLVLDIDYRIKEDEQPSLEEYQRRFPEHVRVIKQALSSVDESGHRTPVPVRAPNVFVSYRREDSEVFAGRLCEHLQRHYGPDAVFFDVVSMPYGVDFPKHIAHMLSRCDVLLAVIGPKWPGARQDGSRRIDQEQDYVRIEIETALANKIPVIPVLVGDTSIPKEDELPSSMKLLSHLNACSISPGLDFALHVQRLLDDLNGIANRGTDRSYDVAVGRPAVPKQSPMIPEGQRSYSVADRNVERVGLDSIRRPGSMGALSRYSSRKILVFATGAALTLGCFMWAVVQRTWDSTDTAGNTTAASKQGIPLEDSSFQVWVWKNDEKLALASAAPLQSGDDLQIVWEVPVGYQVALFWFDTEGQLHSLPFEEESGDSAAKCLAWPRPGKSNVLEGPSGTELVFGCASRTGVPRIDDIEELFTPKTPLPQVLASTVMELDEQGVRVLDTQASRRPGSKERDRFDSQAIARVETLRFALAKKYEFVRGVAFAHLEP